MGGGGRKFNFYAMNYKNRTWIDNKGRTILIYTMSNKWLNNLRKYLRVNKPDCDELKWIKEELSRRKN